jgi:hypothetical protein
MSEYDLETLTERRLRLTKVVETWKKFMLLINYITLLLLPITDVAPPNLLYPCPL